MDILLLGKKSSITATLQSMLQSIDEWSLVVISNLSTLENPEYSEGDFSLIIANLEEFEASSTTVISQIRQSHPKIPLLAIHSYLNQELIQPMIAAGASGYIKNDVSESVLIEAVRKVASGNQYILAEST